MEKFSLPTMYELCLMHARADRVLRAVVAKQLESQKLTMMEWLALCVVVAGPKKGVSMSHIAYKLDVTLPQVTSLVGKLLEAKMTKQKILVSDRRGRQVVCTKRGKNAVAKLEKNIAGAVKIWSKDIDRDQLRAYILTISQLVNNQS